MGVGGLGRDVGLRGGVGNQAARNRCFPKKNKVEHVHVRGALHEGERIPVRDFGAFVLSENRTKTEAQG